MILPACIAAFYIGEKLASLAKFCNHAAVATRGDAFEHPNDLYNSG